LLQTLLDLMGLAHGGSPSLLHGTAYRDAEHPSGVVLPHRTVNAAACSRSSTDTKGTLQPQVSHGIFPQLVLTHVLDLIIREIDKLLCSHPSQQLSYHAWTRLQNKLIACHDLAWYEIIQELSHIVCNMRMIVQLNETFAFFLRCLIGLLSMRQVIPRIAL